ncbi:hypothetical protein [Helicobacter turcicus]|uniref:Integral membrane protein n=1 Tax=Helicobacter turcicus TaxID=2867412 RepID=A0ABS7JMK1_9HELI|nr:hypothetical protein [Helicobacter turcicus]MBX7490629.1 hypothetical protein [Helicobacter turcicus]MBX7545463.1 hypothetical protein [Helicobacter turcicus]
MELFLFIFYLIYIAMALTPLVVIFILQNRDIQIFIYKNIVFNNLIVTLCIIVLALLLSHLYIYCVKKYYQNTQSELMECSEIEIAEPKYIPIYIAYFVIAVSINNLVIFSVVLILIYLLILKGKFSYFNPYLLFSGYHFYEVSVDINREKYAKYKLFLISKQKIKEMKSHNNLIRLNDFTFLDKGDRNG